MTRRAFRPALAFHALTPLYDRANDLLGFGRLFAARAADALALRDGESVLDVGCGTGTLLVELFRRCPRSPLVGIDADAQVLRRARAKLQTAGMRVTLLRAYAQALPFPDGAFDAAVSTLIFHHLPTVVKQAALAEIHRVLKPSGHFLLADFGRPQTTLQWVLLTLGSLFDGTENVRVNLQGRLPPMLQDTGFEVTEAGPRYRAVQFLRAARQAMAAPAASPARGGPGR